jgi:hypothetical protein
MLCAKTEKVSWHAWLIAPFLSLLIMMVILLVVMAMVYGPFLVLAVVS